MNKKILIASIFLLAIVAMGAVSAAEDLDALAADDTGDEQIVASLEETAVGDTVDEKAVEASFDDEIIEAAESDEILETEPEEFNLKIAKEADLKDKNNLTVVSFEKPGSLPGEIKVSVSPGTSLVFYDSENLTLSDLSIDEPGNYFIYVSYGDDLSIGGGYITVTETYTADTFIELYDMQTDAELEEYWVLTVNDLKSGVGLNGTVLVYANGTLVYNNEFKGTGENAKALYAKDLYGNFSGPYVIKAVYNRNGVEYSKQATVEFIGTAQGSTTPPNPVNPQPQPDSQTNSTPQQSQTQSQQTVKKTTTTKTATKIVAAKKTFKAKVKVKKYVATLKAGKKALKGMTLTLKIGKKTFKAKTNKKGKATFKITKFKKKGTYKATIKFAGNKNYKASSKKVKITIKK